MHNIHSSSVISVVTFPTIQIFSLLLMTIFASLMNSFSVQSCPVFEFERYSNLRLSELDRRPY
jgi:hypothetical protein